MPNPCKEVEINGNKYVLASELKPAETLDGMEYSIIRTYSAGAWAGYVKSRVGKEIVLCNARRLWYWDGAASLSQMAVDGTSKPNKCKFPCEVSHITLTECIEIIPATEKAKKSIAGVSIWTA